jgi:hypothetical protein
MKKVIFFFVVLVASVNVFATVRTVSSNPATLGQFSTIQAAIDASTDSDTVYVYGSPNIYPTFTIQDKKITVIGPGWAPDKNLPLQAFVLGCTFRNTVNAGSPNGSELQGLIFTQNVDLNSNDQVISNLRLIRCQFNQTISINLSSSGYLFEGCLFLASINFSGSETYTNFLFQNNLFFANTCCTGSGITSLTNAVNVRFDHNIFYADNSGAVLFGGICRFLTLSNNIFNNRNAAGNLSFSTFNNNITSNTTQNAPWSVNSNVDGGGNVSGQNPQMVDQAQVNAGSFSGLLNFTIAAGPANNSGSDGKDMGLLYDATGSLNWDNSRNSRVPRIFSMNITTPTITPGGNLSVTVEARKSN